MRNTRGNASLPDDAEAVARVKARYLRNYLRVLGAERIGDDWLPPSMRHDSMGIGDDLAPGGAEPSGVTSRREAS